MAQHQCCNEAITTSVVPWNCYVAQENPALQLVFLHHSIVCVTNGLLLVLLDDTNAYLEKKIRVLTLEANDCSSR